MGKVCVCGGWGGVSSGSKTVQKEVGKQHGQQQPAGPGLPTEKRACLSTKGKVHIKEGRTARAGTYGSKSPSRPCPSAPRGQAWLGVRARRSLRTCPVPAPTPAHSAPGSRSGSESSTVALGLSAHLGCRRPRRVGSAHAAPAPWPWDQTQASTSVPGTAFPRVWPVPPGTGGTSGPISTQPRLGSQQCP